MAQAMTYMENNLCVDTLLTPLNLQTNSGALYPATTSPLGVKTSANVK